MSFRLLDCSRYSQLTGSSEHLRRALLRFALVHERACLLVVVCSTHSPSKFGVFTVDTGLYALLFGCPLSLLVFFLVLQMKFVAAYLLAVLAGNASPSAEDLTAILESVGCEVDNERMELLLSQLSGKDITELIAAGREKFASVPCGGGGILGRPWHTSPRPRPGARLPPPFTDLDLKEAKELVEKASAVLKDGVEGWSLEGSGREYCREDVGGRHEIVLE
ncbi:60S acidic ribosomal protein P2A [Zea mays]|uniref:60S acidic ribosomal protein P2A n=1 Tax=Zea mays TaxID=4577 RepID=A0A3L6DN17_MAIZE|nr:60S acidic ribosomal protein P2A [Zea mays]